LTLVRDLLAIRRREIVPRLAGAAFGQAQAADNALLTASWRMGDGTTLRLLANLSVNEIVRPQRETIGRPIWGGEAGERMAPWSVFWRLDAR
jgi:maltooligosyltrehalose trehalohydrolase